MTLIKKLFFIILLFFTITNCGRKQNINQSSNNDINRLSEIFNKYCDTITEISINGSTITIFQKEQCPKLKSIIDLKNIDKIKYQYVKECPSFPYQISLSCFKKNKCIKGLYYPKLNRKPNIEFYDCEVFIFKNKRGTLEAFEILNRIKNNIDK